MDGRDALKIKATSLMIQYMHWHAFKCCRNNVNSEIKLAEQNCCKEVSHECVDDPKKTWEVMNRLTSRKFKGSFVKKIKHEGVTVNDLPGLSDAFSNNIVTIGPKPADEISFDAHNHFLGTVYINI